MIKFILGKNGTGKTTYINTLAKDKKSIHIETNQKIEDLTSNTKDSSYLVRLLEVLEQKNIKDLETEMSRIFSHKHTVSFNGKSDNVSFNCTVDNFKGLLLSNNLKIYSAGEQASIAIDLLFSNSKSLKADFNTILIDEIDSFLHPSLFNEIAEKILEISKDFDVVISTHNPNFIRSFGIWVDSKGAENFEVYYFGTFMNGKDRIADINTFKINPMDIHNIVKNYLSSLEKIDLAKKHRIFKLVESNDFTTNQTKSYALINQLFLNAILESLFEINVILVEGPTELIYYSQNKIVGFETWRLVSTFGKFFMYPIADFLKNLNINVHCVFDEDNASDATNNEINTLIATFSHKKLVKNIEDEEGILKVSEDKIINIIFHLIK